MCDVGVFFCKQKTAYEMRISDWSSDVCSSDLDGVGLQFGLAPVARSGVVDPDAAPGVVVVVLTGVEPTAVGAEHAVAVEVTSGGGIEARGGLAGQGVEREREAARPAREGDRKSTRLNSSH